jgi:hypothetical protein
MKAGPQSGFSSWAYIHDREYARNAEHYVRSLNLIQNDLRSIFEYIEPSDECLSTYSYRVHALLMRTCIEVEANFRAILEENTFTPRGRVNMRDYRRIDVTHHLSSYEVILPIWNGQPHILRPFSQWRDARGRVSATGVSIPWYQAYNASKHDRQEAFKEANFGSLLMAVAGLLVLVSSQFRDKEFDAGPTLLSIGTGQDDFHSGEAAIGSLFRIVYPDDWTDEELYDFDWMMLRAQPDRFAKINYDAVPA